MPVQTPSPLLVTGATGFVGRAVCARMMQQGLPVVMVTRVPMPQPGVRSVAVGEIGPDTDWRAALAGCGAVLHLAARVHVMREVATDAIGEFRRTNVEGTLALARQAAMAGVRRFVYVSSIKVNGEETAPGRPFKAQDTPAPEDAYAMSKFEAEQGLRALCADTGMEFVVIRPPLVYGPGVRANFATMMRWVARGLPLPLGAITANRRSLVGVDNLVDLLITCVSHPAAAGQVFLASDGEDLSTADLLKRIGIALGRPARLLPVPEAWLRIAARLIGRPGIAQRLCGSLQLDIGHTCQTLGWSPPVTVDEGLRRAASGLILKP
jgi:nucleoside-diphosphate-sugar epimerase